MGIKSIPVTHIFIYKFLCLFFLPKQFQDPGQIQNPSTWTEMLRFKLSQHR